MPGHTLPPPCTFLNVGQAFAGTQNVSNMQKDEAWKVNVRLQGVDMQSGYLCGSMEALNVPAAETPVVTFWEGEIVDNRNYSFYTGQWDATKETDVKHWSKFASFLELREEVQKDGGKSIDLVNHPYIFMRWKEKFFVNVGTDCGLTIAGFYYVCFSRSDGSVNGFYYDPNSRYAAYNYDLLNVVLGNVLCSPYQKLELKATNEGRAGHSFATYQFQ
ncbi:uncharacterized protein [Physcomitrium patens]|uniref:Glucose-induced degradation protein 4 homolog n=3 Tax=Physcomitrium patens TaxID=3218 RepID=A0A7I4DXY3_PHYPA|nr:glucose-induced degradation protein 4 homolog isoform X2 [Physcomitrium patens]|eukprot:XP_024377492.1 glucose-induced degradation protein 4 homolog isoform X2 [Physcomitrella patens]